MSEKIINASSVLSAKLAKCYIKVVENGISKTYNFAQATKVEAKIERNKVEFGVLGCTSKAHKNVGWKGTGSCTLRYNTNFFTKMFERFKDNAEDVFFEMVIDNSDGQTANVTGHQKIRLINCSLDGGLLAKFDVDTDILDQDVNFTFDDFIVSGGAAAFKPLPKEGTYDTL